MTNDEINKYIHERIMGKCWHELTFTDTCTKCGRNAYERNQDWDVNPDYCSDSSPRSLLNEVVAKLPTLRLIKALASVVRDTGGDAMLKATAEQIARACVEAHKNGVVRGD